MLPFTGRAADVAGLRTGLVVGLVAGLLATLITGDAVREPVVVWPATLVVPASDTGHTVVETTMTSVVNFPTGQFVTVDAHDVTV